MDLEEYLKTRKLTHTEFAKIIKVSPVTISNYICGRRKPRLEIAEAIEEATNKRVTMKDLLENWKRKKALKSAANC